MMEEQNKSSIVKLIWEVSSRLRGLYSYEQMVQVVAAFTVLRRIDCFIGKYSKECASFYLDKGKRLSDERLAEKLCEVSGGYPFYNYSGYNFREILLSSDSIEVTMNSYLQSFSDNVQEILEGMNFHQNLAILQRQSRFLVELFEQFAKLDLSEEAVDKEDFVELMSSLFDEGGRFSGEFHTDYALSNLISDCLLSEDLRINKEDYVTIYDPVCGTGGMLATAGLKAKSFAIHQSDICLYGQEISLFPSAVAKALVLLCGNEYSMVVYANTLTEDCFSGQHFQYILADYPFGVSWKPIQSKIQMEALDSSGRFSIGLPAIYDSQFLFIEHIISKMSSEGSRAAFITSPSTLWTGDARSGESRIRRWMFEHDLVETIIALPAGSLTFTNIPVYLWILSNKKNESQVGKVRLIDASSMNSKNRRNGLDYDMVKFIVDEYKSNIMSTKSQIVRNEQFGYFEVDLLEDGKKKDRVTISLDTDIHEFVEKEYQPYAKDKVTVDYASVEKGYSVQFDKFFAQEKVDVASLIDASHDLLSVVDSIEAIKKDIIKIKGRTEAKAWNELPLRVATEVVLGGSKPTVENPSGLPLLSVSYLRKPSNDEPLYEITPKTRCSTKDDVIIIVKGENTGEVFRGVDGILTSSVAAIKCIDEDIIFPQFFYYLLKGSEKDLRTLATGAIIKSLDLKTIKSFKCSIPPMEEQIKMASYLDDIVGKIDDVINALGGSENVFSSYRQTLIENVIRGRVLIK